MKGKSHKYLCDVVIRFKIQVKIAANYNLSEKMNPINGL